MKVNVNIPYIRCFVRKEFLYNLEDHFGELEEAHAFAINSKQGHAIGFHVMLNNGSQFYGLPIHSLAHRHDAPIYPLDFLELWNCFSYDCAVTEYRFLQGMRCKVIMKDGHWEYGTYLFTVDWSIPDPDYIDCTFTQTEEHKCAHIIRLDCGNFAAQPNNRIRWFEPSFITKSLEGVRPDYRLNYHSWNCETSPKWRSEDSEYYFYQMEEIAGEAEKEALSDREKLNQGSSLSMGAIMAKPKPPVDSL